MQWTANRNPNPIVLNVVVLMGDDISNADGLVKPGETCCDVRIMIANPSCSLAEYLELSLHDSSQCARILKRLKRQPFRLQKDKLRGILDIPQKLGSLRPHRGGLWTAR